MGQLDHKPDDKSGVLLNYCPDPFNLHNKKELIPAGGRVSDIVAGVTKKQVIRTYTHVWIEGDPVPRSLWPCIRMKAGASITIRVVPQGGGGGKNPLNAILSLALMAVAPGIGTALASSIGFGGFWAGSVFVAGSTILGGAVSLAGRLLINAIAPPPKQQARSVAGPENPTLFVAGARNQLIPWGSIPRVYGKMRLVPPYGAKPFTETSGNDQYVRMLFCLGYGPLEVTEMRIGDTLLSEFEGVETEIREGYDDDAPLTLFTESVHQNDLNITLRHTGLSITGTDISITGGNQVNFTGSPDVNPGDSIAMSGWSSAANNDTFTVATVGAGFVTTAEALTNDAGGEEVTIGFLTYATRATLPETDEISVDVTFPNGLVDFAANGSKRELTVQVEVQYSIAGMNDWSNSVSAYTGFIARDVGSLQKPSSNTTAYIYRVYMDPADGELYTTRGGRYRFADEDPDEPIAPAGMLSVARIERRGNDNNVIPAARITDERDPGLVGDFYEAAGDFLPGTAAGNHTISIAAGGLSFPGIKITAKQTSAIVRNLRFRVPRGQYDVRLKRVTEDSDPDDSTIFDTVNWSALRSIRNEQPINKTGLALVALRIKATDQLNGAVDQFNCIAHSILPDWDGAAWTENTTSNPASIYRNILQGSANAKPLADARVDLPGLAGWHEGCADAGREFNGVFDGKVSLLDALQQVSSCGRAFPTLVDGKWGVVQDIAQSVPVQHFTPRNSWGFRGEKSFAELPKALRIRFLNREKGWLPDERIVFDDGYDADNVGDDYETIELPGVTLSEQAWKEGRYHIATARLRPEVFSFMADFEHIVCTRGDLIRLNHDVPLIGLGSQRVKAVTVLAGMALGIELDGPVLMEEGTDYCVRVRRANGESFLQTVETVAGENTELTFTDTVDEADAPEAGDLALFGVVDSESIELIIKEIVPSNDLTARLVCVPASPAVHTADTGTIPAYNSQLTTPPDLRRPPSPIVLNVQSGQEALLGNPDGTVQVSIIVTLAGYDFPFTLTPLVKIRATSENIFSNANVIVTGSQLRITNVEVNETYELQLFYTSPVGITSAPAIYSGVTVTGAAGRPPDVTGFQVGAVGNTAFLSWNAANDPLVDHYILRFSNATSGVTWGTSIDLVDNVPVPATSFQVPAVAGTYLIKAVNFQGLESENEDTAVLQLDETPDFDPDETVTEHPDFGGAKTNIEFDGTGIRLAGADSIDDWANVDEVSNFDVGESGFEIAGVYNAEDRIDRGMVENVRLVLSITVAGVNLIDNFDSIENVDEAANIDGSADPSEYSLVAQVRRSNDDAIWSAWSDFIIGDYTGRYFEFRLVFGSLAFGVSPYVTEFSVSAAPV